MLGTTAHEQSHVGVVDEVVEDGVLVHGLVGQQRALLSMGIHADRGTVDDDIIVSDHLGGDVFVLDGVGALIAADEDRLDVERPQTEVDGLRGSACAQDV